MYSSLSEVRPIFWTSPYLNILCVFLILLQLDSLCTSAVKRHYAKRPFTIYMSPIFPCTGVQTIIWSIPYSGQLCNKNCIVKTSEMLIIWSAYHYTQYTAGSDESDTIEGVPHRLQKKSSDGRCLGYTVDMLNCCWPMVFIVSDNCQFWLKCVQ